MKWIPSCHWLAIGNRFASELFSELFSEAFSELFSELASPEYERIGKFEAFPLIDNSSEFLNLI